jgi:hypothetical protein
MLHLFTRRDTSEFARLWHKEWNEALARTAGPAEQKLAGAVQCANPSVEESEQLSVPPSEMKGGPEKLPTEPGQISTGNSRLLEVVD